MGIINEKKDNYLKVFFIIGIGLILTSIAFPFVVNYFFSDWTKSGTFGDTFGALNALFSGLAFTGVIVTILIQRAELKNQRLELSLQRNEMRETRKEFLLNRTTTLVYNQLERFDKAIKEFKFIHDGKEYIGNEAIIFLHDNKETVYNPIDKPEDVYREEMKGSVIKLIKLYSPNRKEIEKFAHIAYNSVSVLKRLIFKTQLEIDQLNELKNLFYVNIGFINMGVIECISDVSKNEVEYLKAEDHIENDIEIGELMRANIFLKPIKEFYDLRLTEENFEEHKSIWQKSVGANI